MPSSLTGRSFIVISLVWPDRFFLFFFGPFLHHPKEKRKKAVWPCETILWSGRQTKILQLAKILKFGNFNLKARLGCLNGFMVLVASCE